MPTFSMSLKLSVLTNYLLYQVEIPCHVFLDILVIFH